MTAEETIAPEDPVEEEEEFWFNHNSRQNRQY